MIKRQKKWRKEGVKELQNNYTYSDISDPLKRTAILFNRTKFDTKKYIDIFRF